ncbi:MAG TPA: hypothetical protein DEP45_00110 [Armatimonadetes bacterium]|nr:hypothetical protein [Armatimonadota bacterium]
MIGGKDWLELAVVLGIALGVLTLMVAIQGAQNARSRRQIVGTVALIWGTMALTLTLAWQLEEYWGGALIDVLTGPRPEIVTRSLTGGQAVALGLVLLVTLAGYVASALAVRRLTASTASEAPRPDPDEADGGVR